MKNTKEQAGQVVYPTTQVAGGRAGIQNLAGCQQNLHSYPLGDTDSLENFSKIQPPFSFEPVFCPITET